MKEFSLVIGCGDRGAKWIGNPPRGEIIGLDNQQLTVRAPLIRGDVFDLPIRSGSVGKIYGDFIINGLLERKIAAPQILENPDVLDTDFFPQIVRDWFTQSMARSHDSVRRNVREVSNLLKTAALREMWRVLASRGRLQILDYQYNTNWLMHYAPQIVNEDLRRIEVRPMRITDEDYVRSSNLDQGVVKGSTYVAKIELIKRPVH